MEGGEGSKEGGRDRRREGGRGGRGGKEGGREEQYQYNNIISKSVKQQHTQACNGYCIIFIFSFSVAMSAARSSRIRYDYCLISHTVWASYRTP